MRINSEFTNLFFTQRMGVLRFFGVLKGIKDLKPYQEVSMWSVYFPLNFVFMLPFAFIKNKLIAFFIYISGFVAYLIT